MMKKNRLLIISFFLTSICYAQKISTMDVPKINNKPEKFDYSLFTEYTQIDNSKKIAKNNDRIIVRASATNYTESNAQNIKDRVLYFSKYTNDEVSGYDYRENPLFGIYKEFHANGNIKLKGLYCWFGFKMGIWYYFNENGSLQKEIDMDEGFSFTHQKVFEYCIEKDISLEKRYDGYRTRIYRGFNPDYNDEKTWTIVFPDLKREVEVVITLRGTDGKILDTTENQLPRE